MFRLFKLLLHPEMLLSSLAAMATIGVWIVFIVAAIRAKPISSTGSALMLSGSILGLCMYFFNTAVSFNITSIIDTLGSEYFNYFYIGKNFVSILGQLLLAIGLLRVVDVALRLQLENKPKEKE